jgi:hypothetical protein
MATPLIKVENLKKDYVNDEVVTHVLHGVTFEVPKGQFVAIMGPSGSGKSTLMHILGFLDTLTTGRYLFDGQDVSTFDDDELARLRGAKAGFIFQAFNPLPRESTFASRIFFGRSTGEDPQVFRLGGSDRIRGLSQGLSNKRSNIALSSVEMRWRIKYLNARTKFLFPDFFFKAAYLIAFDDFGYAWDNAQERDHFNLSAAENSTGLGITWPTFILQSFKMDLSIQWARRTTTGSDT